MPDLRPWTTQGAGDVVDVSDRAVRLLGHVAVDGTADVSDRAARVLGVADLSDRIARALGHVIVDALPAADITDRAARALGAADVTDRAARLLGHVAVDGTADVSDRAARLLGVADLSDRGARRAGAVTPPAQWSVTHAPAAAAIATVTRAAAGAGIRHVCTAIIATIAGSGAPSTTFTPVVLRDGATGVGTPLLGPHTITAQANGQSLVLALTRLFIPGSPNTAMTLEFTAASANNVETVTLVGYDTDTI